MDSEAKRIENQEQAFRDIAKIRDKLGYLVAKQKETDSRIKNKQIGWY